VRKGLKNEKVSKGKMSEMNGDDVLLNGLDNTDSHSLSHVTNLLDGKRRSKLVTEDEDEKKRELTANRPKGGYSW